MAAEILSRGFEEHRKRFFEYTESFKDVPDAAPLRLKVEHTLKVFEHACRIVESLGDTISPELGRASVLAALYHDCGRFPQFKEYRTFLDAKSVNHAVLSFQTMRDRAFLKEEELRVRSLAQCAVLLHNRHKLSPMLDRDARFVTDVVRDADKLDIMEIFLDYLDHPENPAVVFSLRPDEPVSPEVLAALRERRSPNHAVMRSVSDFTAAKLVWAFDLNYRHSRREFLRRSYFERLMEHLPEQPELEELHRTAVDFLAKA